MAFYVIYIQEAHPSDKWQLPVNIKDSVVFASPRSAEERSSIANSCVRDLGIQLPALVDDMANSTEKAYTGWPDRLYVIDREGKVAFKTRAGPFGFDPEAMEQALRGLR